MSRRRLRCGHPIRAVVLAACGAAVLAGACSSSGGTAPVATDPAGSSHRLSGRLVVLAASSLTEPFEALGRAFEATHPGVTVRFSFDGSPALARQIDEGADADVFASADQAIMRSVVGAGEAADPVSIARNRLAILVAPGNPLGVRTLGDVVRPGLVLVVCAREVPCGRLAATAFRSAGLSPEPSSFEPNVKAVVAKVVLGEADAGIVYRSDVHAAGRRAQGIDIAARDGQDVETTYLMAVTSDAANAAAARSWVAFVRSPAGRAALTTAGFTAQ